MWWSPTKAEKNTPITALKGNFHRITQRGKVARGGGSVFHLCIQFSLFFFIFNCYKSNSVVLSCFALFLSSTEVIVQAMQKVVLMYYRNFVLHNSIWFPTFAKLSEKDFFHILLSWERVYPCMLSLSCFLAPSCSLSLSLFLGSHGLSSLKLIWYHFFQAHIHVVM